jgi:hypothetical protein
VRAGAKAAKWAWSATFARCLAVAYTNDRRSLRGDVRVQVARGRGSAAIGLAMHFPKPHTRALTSVPNRGEKLIESQR